MSAAAGNGAHDPSPQTACQHCGLPTRVSRVEQLTSIAVADGAVILAELRRIEELLCAKVDNVAAAQAELARTQDAMVAVLDAVARKG